MDEIEVISKEVVFEVGTVVILEEIVVGIEIEKIGGLGDNQDQERGIRARSESSSRSRSNLRVSTNRDRVRCFKCREYDHFANECPNLVLEDLDRESDSARQASLQILADNNNNNNNNNNNLFYIALNIYRHRLS